MASRLIVVFLRIFGRRRRFALNLIVAVLLFITGFFTFYARPPDEPPIKSASSKTFYENILRDCPCSTKQQTEDDMAKPSAAVTASKSFTSNKQALRGSGSTAGRLNVHIWSEVCGSSVDILRNWPHFPYFPNERSFISEFRKTQELGSFNYGARIFGFIHPKRSGRYKFAITSDDTSELWLSPNEDPASSEMIARVYLPYASAWTEEGDYNRYPEQISKEITLQAGKKYYIESLHKQGYGFAHLSVYWSYSFSKLNLTFNIISSMYLSSFSATDNQEYIPPHAGMPQSNNSLQEKSSFLYFNRLPLINRKEYRSHIPTCPYSPSFLVRRKLQRYEGITLTSESRVFPQDDTDMIQSNFRPAWTTPNKLINKTLSIEPVVEKFILSLRSR